MKRIACLLLLCCNPAAANEPADLYQSLDESRLGRIFLSPMDRLRLERQRGSSAKKPVSGTPEPAEHSTDIAATQPVRQESRSSGKGIIVATDRTPLVWVNGRFVRQPGASADKLRGASAERLQTSVTRRADSHSETDEQPVGDRDATTGAKTDGPDPDGER